MGGWPACNPLSSTELNRQEITAMKKMPSRTLLAALLLTASAATQAQALRVGLAEDPDVLDPTLARTFVGRLVFAALCDKLVDVDEKLTIVPQLALSWAWSTDNKALTMKLRPGVKFHDGEPLDAAAVKFNLERHKTLPGSNRRGELAPLASVDVVDPLTVRLNLSAPFSPLLATLADRAGMMVSPKAAQAAGDKFGSKPVCSGPFKFVERVAQDRMVFERFDGYWNKAAVHFDKITYTPIPDATVRLANLKSGQLDFIERVASSDIEKLKSDKKLKTASITEIGYQGITINIAKSDRAKQNPLGRDARVREAFELSLDRQGLAQVVMDNEAQVGNQWVAPSNTFYAKNMPVPKRDVARARALLKEAGVPNPSFTLVTPTTSDAQRLALVVQAMTRDAGFDVKIQAAEFATSLNMADKGDFEAYVLAWSGRADPDGNTFSFHACKQPLNYSGYCSAETDALLNQARTLRDVAERKKVYEQVAAQVLKERPIIYLYHRNWLWAYNANLSGVRQIPDGLLRVTGLKLAP
jgi:peptide/nickel transport system substrate-binding protein